MTDLQSGQTNSQVNSQTNNQINSHTDSHTDSQTDPTKKFYSQRSIGIATFFGGPLAAGVLVRQNFLNLGKEDHGRNALFIGIIATILLFAAIFAVPEHIMDKVPNFVIPAVYTGIIYLIVERLQGQVLGEHEGKQGQFYSGWKAAGVGALCMLIMFAGIIGYVLIAPDDFDTDKYDDGITEFQINEDEALILFSLLESEDAQEVTDFIQEIGIPAWRKNIQILDELDAIEGLYQEYKEQNQVLREYCQQRIASYQLLGKSFREDTDAYNLQIEDLNRQIEELLERL